MFFKSCSGVGASLLLLSPLGKPPMGECFPTVHTMLALCPVVSDPLAQGPSWALILGT